MHLLLELRTFKKESTFNIADIGLSIIVKNNPQIKIRINAIAKERISTLMRSEKEILLYSSNSEQKINEIIVLN